MPSTTVRIATPKCGDLEAVSRMIAESFKAHAEPDMSGQGRERFLSATTAEALAERLSDGRFARVAWKGGKPVGYLEIGNNGHVHLFFTDKEHIGQGIGRRLFDLVLAEGRWARLTVRSSPYAIPIYKHLGFAATGNRETRDGITFLPMALEDVC